MIYKTNIALIGARGVGKSKLSRRLKKLFNRPLMSTDILVSYENGGLSIAELVAKVGWIGFRQLEYDVLKKLSQMQNIIIDCGGGILFDVTNEKSRTNSKTLVEHYSKPKAKLLKKRCHVIFLQHDENWLLHKNVNSSERPELFGSYQELLKKRFSYYEEAADYVVNMKKHSIEEAANLLYKKYFHFVGQAM